MIDDKEIEKLKAELKTVYLDISKAYVRMSKTSDNYSFNIIQSGIDGRLRQAAELRDMLEAARKAFFAEWDKRRYEGPNKSQYD